MPDIGWMPMSGGMYMVKAPFSCNLLQLKFSPKYVSFYFLFLSFFIRCYHIKIFLFYSFCFKFLFKCCMQTQQVASSSSAEWNWSTCSFIHSVKHNLLGAKIVDDLVYIHSNLCLLSHKNPEYNDGVIRNWDLAPKCADLDATDAQLAQVSIDDHEAALALDTYITSGSVNQMDCGMLNAMLTLKMMLLMKINMAIKYGP